MNSIPRDFRLRQSEQAWFDQAEGQLPFKANPYYLQLAAGSEALRRQVIPTEAELEPLEYESSDPLSEEIHSPLPRMVHRYKNRIALLLTDNCSIHCRHCFRRTFTGTGSRNLSLEDCDDVINYVNSHPEIREILLTGGDPLTMPESDLEKILRQFRRNSSDSNLVLRLATRIPAVHPGRITPGLLSILSDNGPLWMVVQFNHPDELTETSRKSLDMIRKSGIPMVNQTVLLKGVNDNADTLADLFQDLLSAGVKPYYLFQGDLARGTSHFRVPLEKGWRIMDELRVRISGLAMPVFAVDLPGGGGKIPLSRSLLIRETATSYIFNSAEMEGREYEYPKEKG